MPNIEPEELIQGTYYLITNKGPCKEMQSFVVAKFLEISNNNDNMFYSTDMKCPIAFNMKNGWAFSELNLIDKYSLVTHRYFSRDGYLSDTW
jgi:hypothetical protein